MGHYRLRELFLAPNLISIARVPLAMLFPLCVGRPVLAVAVLGAAAVTDVLDGWWARRSRQATAIGAVLDGVTDKIFVLSVVVTLLSLGRLSPSELALLSAREIGEAPLVFWWAVSGESRRRKRQSPRANVYGKAATTLQFVAVAVVTAGRAPGVLIPVTAVLGVTAAVSYWHRELAAHRVGASVRTGPAG